MRRLVGVIAAIALSFPCIAQAPPNLGPQITSSTSELSASQKAVVEQYVNAYASNLAGADIGAAVTARVRLVSPLGNPGISDIFREDYANLLIPALEPILSDSTNHVGGMNAMRIIAELRTSKALRTAAEYVNSNREPRAAIRSWAAIAVREAATKLMTNQIHARTVDAATRAVARAAEQETEWLVLLRQLQALGAIDTPVARNEELDVLSQVTDRMSAENGPSELVHAVYPAILDIRYRVTNPALPPTALTAMGKDLAPILGKVLEVAEEHWDSAQEDAESKSTYGNLVSVTEQTIKQIDTLIAPREQRAPQTRLKESWEQKNKNRFVQDVQQWMDRIGSSIYK